MVMGESPLKIKDDAYVVRRSLSVPGLQCASCADVIQRRLSEVEGVHEVNLDVPHKRLQIVYDVAQVSFDAIENALENIGFPASDSRWARLKSGWYCYLDENARANAETSGGSCCGNPRDIYAKRHK